MNRRGFTLLELLIVIAILAVLATVAVLVINPLEYLRQARDAKRIGDIEALNKALGLADFEGISLGGTSTTVFVSLLDVASSTCGTLGLPPLPTGYRYHCDMIAANLNRVDGTGWIPVNLTALTGKSPLGALPIDPINSATAFYSYIPGGSFALSASLESEKYLKQSALTDGGTNPGKIEMGSDLRLLASGDGLIGYWPFDEGSGLTASDVSGKMNNATLNNGSTWMAGKVGKAVSFDGVDDFVSMGIGSSYFPMNTFSTCAWIKSPGLAAGMTLNGIMSMTYGLTMSLDGSGQLSSRMDNGTGLIVVTSSGNLYDNLWHFVCVTYDGIDRNLYIDGALKNSTATTWLGTTRWPTNAVVVGHENNNAPMYKFNGLIDEPRIYSRALPAPEIQAIYDATK